jgi:hypothetical protein
MEVGGCGAWCFVVVVGGRVSGGMVLVAHATV